MGESKQARMLPYVAIGYGKRSAEAAGLNRTINPPPYYGKRSAEAVGLPAAPVAAYGRKEPFRAARHAPLAPLEAAAPAAPVADATYKKRKEKKQARMLPYVAVGGGAPNEDVIEGGKKEPKQKKQARMLPTLLNKPTVKRLVPGEPI